MAGLTLDSQPVKTVRIAVDFFDNDKIKHLASLPKGGMMILTWLKLITLAGKVNDGGRVYTEKGKVLERSYLSEVCGITEDEVEEFFKRFKRMRMIRFEDDGTLRLTNWMKYQTCANLRELTNFQQDKKGKESSPPIPPYKEKPKNCVFSQELNAYDFQDNISTDSEVNSLSVNSQTQVEDIYSSQRKEIVNYLNLKLNTNYHYNSSYVKEHINARLKQGFVFDDFKRVIDGKYEEWKGTDMEKYLRPQTLFCTKFESYLYFFKNKERLSKDNDTTSFNEEEFIKAALSRKDF